MNPNQFKVITHSVKKTDLNDARNLADMFNVFNTTFVDYVESECRDRQLARYPQSRLLEA